LYIVHLFELIYYLSCSKLDSPLVSRYDAGKSKPPESCVNRGCCPGAMPQSHPSELAVMVFFR